MATILYALRGDCGYFEQRVEAVREALAFATAAGSLTTIQKGAISAIPSVEEILECMRSASCIQ